MGREIRRVPAGWEHPKDERGRYKPLLDEDYDTAARKWLKEVLAWEDGSSEYFQQDPTLKQRYTYFWEYEGGPPNREVYRPAFTAPAVCYQIYETVSEGTPISPVFDNLEELIMWLVAQGYSPTAARRFAQSGWAPSMVSERTPSGIRLWNDIESLGGE